MEKLISLEPFLWFAVLVFPGLISMHIYRLFIAARAIEWKTATLEAFFYSAVNFAICLPLIVWLLLGHPEYHPILAILAGFFVIMLGPVLWPTLWVCGIRHTDLMRKLQLPYPTAWDAFFDQRKPCFLLITLKSGQRIGGLFGTGSYASSFPNDGDLYLSAVYKIDQDGRFLNPIPETRGLLIRKDEYSLIELFEIPKEEPT